MKKTKQPSEALTEGKSEPCQTMPLYTRAQPRQFRRRITAKDARDFAELAAKRLTDTEICAVLGITTSGWRHWRAKHPEFEDIYAQARGAKIEAHLKNIEKHAPDDWRASQAYVQLTEPSRFASQALKDAPQTVNVAQINVNVFTEAARRVYGPDALPVHKALPPVTQDAANDSVVDFVEKMKQVGPPKP